ncbi:MAG: hypothetical protein O7B99_03355, partial [Planctomycetota bacterium]|nr:hypothetical protein [Planctomycetota bacterium]
MRFASILLLALAPVLPGCVAAAVGITAGFLVSQEVLPNDIHTAQVMLDVEEVWAAAQETMRNMS